MGKAALTPVYVSFAWILMISYQLFTQTAVVTVVEAVNTSWPSTISSWLVSRVDVIVFVHAFAWIFFLSSVIPSILLRSKGSVMIQFFVCLLLALVPIWVKDNLALVAESRIVDQIFGLAGLFNDPVYAGLFLMAPYLFMFLLDIYPRKANRGNKETENEDRIPQESP